MGVQIAEIRKQKKMSIYALAKKAGVNQSYLWKLENNERYNPSMAILQKLADALDVSVLDLWKEEQHS
ncbi:helix-turn-helix domain-containing protein [Alicyclobacillus acidoterrestris]|uniref:helix-turn-helix domain-containing protein n=1 Tax=Alicyclobacillus TaxID=29330 RepID=UPI001A8FE1F7|nr:helix-turn-helix transcriptional regulator [Alicyclobacillus suci]